MVEELTTRIREVHPYDLPEIVVLPIVGGDEDYREWISESVRKSLGSHQQIYEDA